MQHALSGLFMTKSFLVLPLHGSSQTTNVKVFQGAKWMWFTETFQMHLEGKTSQWHHGRQYTCRLNLTMQFWMCKSKLQVNQQPWIWLTPFNTMTTKELINLILLKITLWANLTFFLCWLSLCFGFDCVNDFYYETSSETLTFCPHLIVNVSWKIQ